MRNVYIIYRVTGAYRYIDSVFSSKKKALENIREKKLIHEADADEFLITDLITNGKNTGIRWTDESSVINSAYISSEKLR